MIPPEPVRDELFNRMIEAGFTIGNGCCIKCGLVWEATFKPPANTAKLECPRCLAKCSLFYEFDNTTQPTP